MPRVTGAKEEMPLQRPSWLPTYLPELDGLRGLAILGVVLYHCNARFVGTPLHYGSLWGWSGVQLFFVLSGFLITAGLLEARERPRYFHNFHAKRALRIWPVYVLTLLIVYLNAPWFIGPSVWEAAKGAPWLAYLFFVQNLFHVTLPGPLVPTWALACEEQFYFCWVPVVRWVRSAWLLAIPPVAAMVASPLLRRHHPDWIFGNHTLIKLDALALGCLLALGLYAIRLRRQSWALIGFGGAVGGFWAAATFAGGTYLLDTALSVCFAGLVLAAMATTGGRNPANALLRSGPLAFYGRISYSLFLTHIAVFGFFGWVDLWMDRYGVAGNVVILVVRLVMATLVAWAIWRWVERPILRHKKKFAA